MVAGRRKGQTVLMGEGFTRFDLAIIPTGLKIAGVRGQA